MANNSIQRLTRLNSGSFVERCSPAHGWRISNDGAPHDNPRSDTNNSHCQAGSATEPPDQAAVRRDGGKDRRLASDDWLAEGR